ncbi:hypothetical protein SUDANB121_02579 [Nocardiopsis dassonvillei]|uniref:DUF2397 family protein n=1 Tax=Nocardiopsis dassonvillei TaxID=2014 RepID=UPI003F55628D
MGLNQWADDRADDERSGGERPAPRHGRAALLRLASWFEAAEPERAEELAAAAYALYPARHLKGRVDESIAATTGWWQAEPDRSTVTERPGTRLPEPVRDHRAQQARLRDAAESSAHWRRTGAAQVRALLARPTGPRARLDLSGAGMEVLMELLTAALGSGDASRRPASAGDLEFALRLHVVPAPGSEVVVQGEGGELTLEGLRLCVTPYEQHELPPELLASPAVPPASPARPAGPPAEPGGPPAPAAGTGASPAPVSGDDTPTPPGGLPLLVPDAGAPTPPQGVPTLQDTPDLHAAGARQAAPAASPDATVPAAPASRGAHAPPAASPAPPAPAGPATPTGPPALPGPAGSALPVAPTVPVAPTAPAGPAAPAPTPDRSGAAAPAAPGGGDGRGSRPEARGWHGTAPGPAPYRARPGGADTPAFGAAAATGGSAAYPGGPGAPAEDTGRPRAATPPGGASVEPTTAAIPVVGAAEDDADDTDDRNTGPIDLGRERPWTRTWG